MVRSLLFVAAGLFIVLPQTRPEPTVSGASANMESRDVPTLILRITNLDAVGLEAVEVDVQSAAGPVRKLWAAEKAPLGTGGTGEMAVGPLGADRALPVIVRFAIFADGTVAGAPAEVARLQSSSIALADDLSAWRDLLGQLTDVPNAEAVRALREAIDARNAAQATDPSGVRRQVEVWIREERAAGFFAAVARNELSMIATRMRGPGPIAAAARRSPGPRSNNDLSTLVRAVTTSGAVRQFSVNVRNDRDVPLESWAVVLSDVQTGRRLRALSHDAATDLPSAARLVGIPPAGNREVGTYQPDADVAGGVRAHLEFVMWQDLTWQGYPANHQQTLANRERRAQEYEFFIPAIRAAAALPAEQALNQLAARQHEFKSGPLGRQSVGLQVQLDEWARLLATSSDISGRLSTHAEALETAVTSLMRHRQGK